MIIIRTNTVWGPGARTLTDDVQIARGVTLTIAPGARIEGGGHSIATYGTLSAKGTAAAPIFLSDTHFVTSNDAGITGRTVIDHAQLDAGSVSGVGYGSLSLTNSVVSNMYAAIDAYYPRGGHTTISKNLFLDSGGIAARTADGAEYGALTVAGNVFDRTFSYDGAYHPGGPGAALSVLGSGAQRGVTSTGNAFLDPRTIAIALANDGKVLSQNDYFGTADRSKLGGRVHDRGDDSSVRHAVDLGKAATKAPTGLPVATFSFVSMTLPSDIVQSARLLGTGHIDLTGNRLANTLTGNAGNNRLDGGLGADTMAGGAGNDTYIVDDARDVIRENAGQGTDRVVASVSHTLAANVEMLTLSGKGAINATGNALANHLIGNGGNNVLDGKGGADIMEGGAGNDVYRVDHASDRVIEAVGGGRDTVVTTVSYRLAAGQQIETLQTADAAGRAALKLTGNEFGNKLVGNAGANVLDGGAGADEMRGGAGHDTYVVDNARDLVIEAVRGGTDTVLASVSYALRGGQEIESLRLTGSAGLSLTGNEFGQSLVGNSGANVLDGGLGADVLTGGRGADTFVFATKLGAGNVDRITDFAPEDTIRLAKSLFSALAPGELKAGEFKDIAKAKVDADDHILYDSRSGSLFYDADGSGKAAAVKFAVLDNKAALTHADFFVV
ncbi:calcium-binding protein [Methylorubrum sp. SB2]|uniref:calcium-binding protein n=1 Tax=Methylorubrum subtropicum TaxID=3138812 RepID=UPI00313B6FD4